MGDKIFDYKQWISESVDEGTKAMVKRLNEIGIKIEEIVAVSSRPGWSVKLYHVGFEIGASLESTVGSSDMLRIVQTLDRIASKYPTYLWTNENSISAFFIDQDDSYSTYEEIAHGIKSGLLPDFYGANCIHSDGNSIIKAEQVAILFKKATGGWKSDDDMEGSVALDKIS